MSTFLPEITFATPGDLTVVYSQQIGSHVEVGDGLVFINVYLAFTPTFTTASGQVRIANLPANASEGDFTLPMSLVQAFDFPTGTTMLAAVTTAGESYATVVASGSGVAAANVGTSQLVSGGNYFLVFSGFYSM